MLQLALPRAHEDAGYERWRATFAKRVFRTRDQDETEDLVRELEIRWFYGNVTAQDAECFYEVLGVMTFARMDYVRERSLLI